MRIYSIDTLFGDHLEYSLSDECWNENITVTDIEECYSLSEIKQIIDSEFYQMRDELYKEYGL